MVGPGSELVGVARGGENAHHVAGQDKETEDHGAETGANEVQGECHHSAAGHRPTRGDSLADGQQQQILAGHTAQGTPRVSAAPNHRRCPNRGK